MKELITKIKSNKIVLILLLSFLLNICGIFYAYPLLHLVGDETAVMGATLKMINDFSLRPNFADYYYLPLSVYVYLPFYLIYFIALFIFGIVHSIAELRTMVLLDYASFKMLLPVARFVSVLAGCLSVYLVYRVSNLLFKDNERISLWASFFTATSLLIVQLSHFGRVWILQILFVVLGFYYLSLVLVEKKDSLNNYLISGFLIALSFGINAVGGIIYLCFLFVHHQLNKGRKFIDVFIKNKKFWSANLVIFISVAVFYFLHPKSFYNYFGYYLKKVFVAQYVAQPISSSLINSLSFIGHFKILLEYEPLLMVLFLVSLPILFVKERKIFYLLALFIVPYYLTLGPFLRWDLPRYISPIIPFLAIIAAYGLVYFTRSLSSELFKKALLFLISLLFLLMPVYWDIALLKPNTYVSAKQWVENNLSNGESVINLGLDYRLVLNEDKKTVMDISEYTPDLMSARRRYLLDSNEEAYPQPNYYILYRPENRPQDFLSQNQFNYLIVYWWDNEEKKELEQRVSQLGYKLELTQQFYPNDSFINLTDLVNKMRQPLNLLSSIKYTGPYIEIYKISKL